MTDIAIRVENLSKQFHIGAHQKKRNFREALEMYSKRLFAVQASFCVAKPQALPNWMTRFGP